MEDLQISTIDSSVDTRSTSNNYPNNDYDVFISHRGPEVKNTFAGYLHRDLRAHGFQPFLDKKELRPGEYIDPQYIDPQIEGAIESAYVHIVILSPGFADSRWCLDELLLILKKTGDIIIPIFYNVKPSEPRWANDGRYAQALIKHEQTGRYKHQTLENWRNALKVVSYRVGFELTTYNGDEVKLLEKVVGWVLKHCRKAALQEATYATSLPVLQKNSGLLTNLQVLNLSGCRSLQTLSDSLECFTNLETLNISECPSLRELPDSVTNLRSLQVLNISRCKTLRALPDSLGRLTELQTIDLQSCMSLERLPHSLGNLHSLTHLDLSGCTSLRGLPDCIGNLTNLKILDLSRCTNLQELPDSLTMLTSLEVLYVSGCQRLRALPDSFGRLENLQTIDLSSCKSLERLPDSFGSLTNLEVLDLSRCGSLQGLPDSFGYLSNLRDLNLSDCESLRRLPDSFWYLRNLRNLNLSGCRNLPGLSVLQARAKQHGINSTQTAQFSPRFRPPIRSSRCKTVVSASRSKTVVSASAAYNYRLAGVSEFTPMFKIF